MYWCVLWAVDRNNLEPLNLSRLFKVLLSSIFFFVFYRSTLRLRTPHVSMKRRPLSSIFFTVSAIYVIIIKHGKDNSQSQIFTRLNDVPLLLVRCSHFFGEKLIHIEKLFFPLCVSRSNCCLFNQLFASSSCSL